MLHSLLNVMYRLMIKTFEPYAQWLRKNCYNHTLIGTFHVFFFKIEPHQKIKKTALNAFGTGHAGTTQR